MPRDYNQAYALLEQSLRAMPWNNHTTPDVESRPENSSPALEPDTKQCPLTNKKDANSTANISRSPTIEDIQQNSLPLTLPLRQSQIKVEKHSLSLALESLMMSGRPLTPDATPTRSVKSVTYRTEVPSTLPFAYTCRSDLDDDDWVQQVISPFAESFMTAREDQETGSGNFALPPSSESSTGTVFWNSNSTRLSSSSVVHRSFENQQTIESLDRLDRSGSVTPTRPTPYHTPYDTDRRRWSSASAVSNIIEAHIIDNRPLERKRTLRHVIGTTSLREVASSTSTSGEREPNYNRLVRRKKFHPTQTAMPLLLLGSYESPCHSDAQRLYGQPRPTSMIDWPLFGGQILTVHRSSPPSRGKSTQRPSSTLEPLLQNPIGHSDVEFDTSYTKSLLVPVASGPARRVARSNEQGFFRRWSFVDPGSPREVQGSAVGGFQLLQTLRHRAEAAAAKREERRRERRKDELKRSIGLPMELV